MALFRDTPSVSGAHWALGKTIHQSESEAIGAAFEVSFTAITRPLPERAKPLLSRTMSRCCVICPHMASRHNWPQEEHWEQEHTAKECFQRAVMWAIYFPTN